MRKVWVSASAALAMLFAGTSGVQATVMQFSSPDGFTGNETLIEFDELGVPPSAPIESGNGVTFLLLERDSLVETGFSPTSARAPNTTYAREFPPRDGPFFLNTINPDALESDLLMEFREPVRRVAAEIRSGQTANDVEDLTFELYRGALLVADLTIPIRGQDDFFFYGLESTIKFDRWVIRQRPDERFALENLRFEVPEPATVAMFGGGLILVAARRRWRTPSKEKTFRS